MISCRNVASLLMSDQLSGQKWWKRMEVRLHLSMCRLCSRLARQLEQISSGVHQMSDQHKADGDLEARLIRRLSGK